MIFTTLLLLLAASAHLILIDDVYTVPASEWRYVEVVLQQQPVVVECDFKLVSGNSAVRSVLITRTDLQQFRLNRPVNLLAATPFEASGSFRHQVRLPGTYAVIIQNRQEDAESAKVNLRVALDFSGGAQPQVQYVPRRRQLAVILISFAVFFAIVTYSARKLLRAIKG